MEPIYTLLTLENLQLVKLNNEYVLK